MPEVLILYLLQSFEKWNPNGCHIFSLLSLLHTCCLLHYANECLAKTVVTQKVTRILHFNFSPLHCTATSVQSPLQLSFAFEKLAKQLRYVKRCLIVSNIARYFASSIRELMQRVTSMKPGMSPSRFCNYFSTIPSCLARKMCTNYLGIKLVWRSGEKLYKFVVKSSRCPYSGKKTDHFTS